MAGLSDLRIVELGQGIAAPFCTKLLADLGAEVIKVEPPGSPRIGADAAPRRVGTAPHPEKSGLSPYLNTSKLSVTINVASPHGRTLFLRLLQDADILVTDLEPRAARRLRLTYRSLSPRFPRLIVTLVTPFGSHGPHAEYKGTDFVVAHAGGVAYPNAQRCKDPDSQPSLTIPGSLSSFYGGLTAAVATMAAVFARKATDRGQEVDVSLQEAVASNLRHDVAVYTFAGEVPVRRVGFASPTTINMQLPTSDGHIAFLLRPELHWTDLLDILGDPVWAAEPLFQDPRALHLHWDSIEPLLAEETRRFGTRDLYERCQARGITAAPVNTVADAAEHPHFAERGFFVEVKGPQTGPALDRRQPGPPIRFGEPFWRARPAPTPGQHNGAILGQRLGLSRPPEAGGPATPGNGMRPSAGRLPLEGIRVADFSWVHAGPYGTFQLAQLGAEVIKIEGVMRLDNNRDHTPFADNVPGLNRSGQFAQLNAGKKSVTLDLVRPRDLELAKALIAVSDVIVENFSYGVFPGFGLGYEAVRRIRPDVIMLSCSGFGQTGPLRAYRAYMNTIHGFCGLIALNGWPNQPPNPLGGNWTDFVAGTAIPLAVMVALHARQRTGRGQYIDLSMAETLMSLMGGPFMEYFLSGRVPRREGNLSRVSLQGIHRCKDGKWVALAVSSEDEWRALVRLMGQPAWAGDPRFAAMPGRLTDQNELDQRVGAWAAGHQARDLVSRLQKAGVPAGLMANVADLVTSPHLRARGFFADLDHPETGRRTHMRLPYHLRGVSGVNLLPAPILGQHNVQVLADLLGGPADVIDALSREAAQRVATFYQSPA